MSFFPSQHGRMFAFLLILAGTLLFLDNLGILPIADIRAYWPAGWIFLGVAILDRRRSVVAAIWAIALIVCGVLMILGNLGVLQIAGSVFWPVMLIAFGATLLVRPPRPAEWAGRFREAAERNARRRYSRTPAGESFSGTSLNESVVFSSLNRRVETQQFEGGRLETVFGSIELDLSDAAVSSLDRRVAIDVKAVFGGIEITVPATWRVVLKAKPVFGGCADHTVPPRPEPGIEPVTLIVTGEAVFGGIEVRN